jgi:hypothetical protein
MAAIVAPSSIAAASREMKAASPSISMRSKSRAASTTFVSRRVVVASACPRMVRWNCMYSV